MILDSLKHVNNYQGLGNVYKALKFLAETDFAAVELGRYELDDNIFYSVQEYETEPKTIAEAHEKYIDIQLIVSGEEIIHFATIDCDKQLVEAKPEKDVWYYTCATQPVALYAGDFMVMFPSDIHMPAAPISEPVTCRKVVVKIKV